MSDSNKIIILMPLNGIGSRFSEYSVPKPLIKIFDKEMIFWVLDNLNLSYVEKILIPYNFNLLGKFNFEKLLSDKYKNVIFQFIPLYNNTNGAAETINIAMSVLKENELKHSFLTIDCDNIFFEDVLSLFHRNSIKNCIFYSIDSSEKEIFSFIKIHNNKIISIKEKERISNNANSGIFCFEDGNILKKYSSMLLSSNKKQKNEFYISGIYELMIKDNLEISPIEISKFACVGTPEQLKDFIKWRNYEH